MNEARYRQLQALNLKHLLRAGAFQFIDAATPWFPYTSGQVGPYYVQSIAVEQDGRAYADAVNSIVELIRADGAGFDAISGGESRDWDFSNPVAYALQVPHVKLYKDGKTLGAGIAGKRLLHVADLNNEGSSMRDAWKPIIEKHGGRLVGVVFFVDRLEEGVDVMRELSLRARAVVPLDAAAWGIALEQGCVSPAVHEALVRRMADRRAWAVRALLDNPAHFQALSRNPKTRDKALKILGTYPEVRPSLEPLLNASGAPP